MITRQELEAIAGNNPHGFTIKKDGTAITNGYAVALTNGYDGFNDMEIDGMMSVVELCDNWHLGGWLNYGKMILDVVLVTKDLDEAMLIGNEHNQLAIYDLTNDKQIDL